MLEGRETPPTMSSSTTPTPDEVGPGSHRALWRTHSLKHSTHTLTCTRALRRSSLVVCLQRSRGAKQQSVQAATRSSVIHSTFSCWREIWRRKSEPARSAKPPQRCNCLCQETPEVLALLCAACLLPLCCLLLLLLLFPFLLLLLLLHEPVFVLLALTPLPSLTRLPATPRG